MFTGDRSGEWLFRALHAYGFANQPNSTRRDDGFALQDCYITATIRCAPPQNKPLPEEIENCRPYFLEELDLLKKAEIILPLGQIALTQTVRSLRLKGLEIPTLPFGHGKVYPLPDRRTIITTYHPSQQNTQTGKLTQPMFHAIFRTIRKRLDPSEQ
jgi:uracil-DNA glycosylase family 4